MLDALRPDGLAMASARRASQGSPQATAERREPKASVLDAHEHAGSLDATGYRAWKAKAA